MLLLDLFTKVVYLKTMYMLLALGIIDKSGKSKYNLEYLLCLKFLIILITFTFSGCYIVVFYILLLTL